MEPLRFRLSKSVLSFGSHALISKRATWSLLHRAARACVAKSENGNNSNARVASLEVRRHLHSSGKTSSPLADIDSNATRRSFIPSVYCSRNHFCLDAIKTIIYLGNKRELLSSSSSSNEYTKVFLAHRKSGIPRGLRRVSRGNTVR